MTNELFKEFLKHLAKFKTAGECLLIFDGAACHLDLSIVDLTESLGIYLYCLPSNTTHELQPLDKAVYRSFEPHWDAVVLLFLEQNRDKKLTKSRFNIILSKVWSKCMTQSNITSGFKATGLYPFNPNAIPETAFGPSAVTEVPASLTLDIVDKDSLQSSNCSTLQALDIVNKENLQPSNSAGLLAIDTAHEENLQLLGSPKPTNQKSSKSPNEVTLVSKSKKIIEQLSTEPTRSTAAVLSNPSLDNGEVSNASEPQFKETSFYELMPSPLKRMDTTQRIRKKAINY
ncbi:uncharacterized protein LOC130670746 [Microplitis mediator]|uniref:uncharacterized protein LOC130670746 n=1 Tax=Microplitis mediator TaxID=375433 RepID=UPI002554802C|nr:uncharacterized protein LOC130670746 [Microplitis mediator]